MYITFIRFDEYRRYLSEHLVEVVISHWDIAVREVAAEAIARIAVLDLDFACNTIIPALVRCPLALFTGVFLTI
jgi:hypothetical protein